MTQIPKTPFTNLQMEMINLFAKEIPEEQLRQLKVVIAKFLLEKASERANKIWDEKGYSNSMIDDLLNQ